MKKLILILFLLGTYSISLGQVDYSIFLQKKISNKDMKGFTNLSKFKKIVSSDCVEGDCKNGESILKIKIYKIKGFNYKIYHTVLVVGNFKNGKLNGKGAIYYYTENFYSTGEGIYKQQKILDMKKTPYLEYIEGEFKENIITEGVYGLHQETKSYLSRDHGIVNSILTNAFNMELPPLVNYFKKYTYNYNEDQSVINFEYKGKFNSLDFLKEDNILINLEAVNFSFSSDKYDYFKYSITPSDKNGVYNLVNFSNMGHIAKGNPDTNKLITTITIKNYKCLDCDISDKSSSAIAIEKKVKKKEQDKIATTIARAKSFVGHFIRGTYLAYVSDYNSKDGCITATVFPYKVRKKGEYPQSFHDNCDHENYKIVPNAYICPNCDGWGTENVEIVNKINNYWIDDSGKRHDEKTTYENSGKYTDVTCHVCGGVGVVF